MAAAFPLLCFASRGFAQSNRSEVPAAIFEHGQAALAKGSLEEAEADEWPGRAVPQTAQRHGDEQIAPGL